MDIKSATRDLIRNQILAAPPIPHHAPKKNISCQANGLKYQVVPGGYEARFQSNQRASTYRMAEPSKVKFGRRTRHHRTSGEASTRTIKSGSTSRSTGLYRIVSACQISSSGCARKLATLNSSLYIGLSNFLAARAICAVKTRNNRMWAMYKCQARTNSRLVAARKLPV